MVWVSKYRPTKLSEIADQKEALEEILKWIDHWKRGSKPLLLHGPPGTGKTSIIEALCAERNYDLIELNASDHRSASSIQEVIGRSMTQSSLFKKSKIFLIDEIDGLAGREDTGGIGEISKLIKESRFPVVMTANNPYDPKLRNLRTYCTLVKFGKVPVWDIERRLAFILQKEGVRCEKDVLRQLSKMAEGDMRSAINDLETLSMGKTEITAKDFEALGYREKEVNIFDALKIIFKTKGAMTAKLAISNVDKDPDEIFWWIESNILAEYEKPEEIAQAFEALSIADLFRQRVGARQNWGMRSYMVDMMTAGVAVAKKEMYRKFTRYQYPSRIAVLGSTKVERKEEKERLTQLSAELHCSTRKVRKEFLPYLRLFEKQL
jgi:replication factor C large subunit